MTLLNPSFEDAGAAPGQAAHWTLITSVAAERLAGFGPDPHRAWEDFERWSELVLSLGQGDVALAFFDPLAEGFEDFEDGWDNDLYLIELPSGHVIAAPFGGGAVEDLEEGWDNVPYARAWEEVAGVTGIFDGEPVEDFNEQWHGNESFLWEWEMAVGVIAAFDGATQNFEDFENGWTAATTI
ncbi:MAG: hypothetical protein A2284_09430 [Deltaproteobacteria bacterium RIFOXYA12_FULL_61_11]|nr:MAG: hypothetical protein A2284_09430 [Deltaproteobacteria bacterium RIFOXYA12_FULL_61_11]